MRKSSLILLIFIVLIGGCKGSEVTPIASDEFFVIAHRGASTYAPEHTMVAYEVAEQLGATYIEIDLQMTKDGALIAMHDEKVDRTTDGEGLVKDFTLEELKELNAGKWFNDAYPEFANDVYEKVRVPTLREIFENFGDRVNYYIEMKSPKIYEDMEEELLAMLEEYNLLNHQSEIPKVIVQSFNRASLIEFHELEPSISLIQLLSYKEKAELTNQEIKSLNIYASGIGVNVNAVDGTFIHEAQENGLKVHLFSLKSEADIKKALIYKADGIFADAPNIAIDILQNTED
ncbi:glycerophosphodiester phosphodiesterase family protein [Psychrobacillus sp. FSL K6-2843]|uniref:glycerophosphodiester phosphodiesterase family protein n=1 Tax=Psychrobacillus sp. FSL K6-2843 TaxID=2921549 RepID=UPI00315A6A52